MATPHLSCEPGDVAEVVLLPGDPYRARWIANEFLSDVVLHNEVRGMLGYTGTWEGHRVSVQGTGMGIPSISIYLHELLDVYGVKTAIRIGSAGSLKAEIGIGDLVLAQSAATTSAFNDQRLPGIRYAPSADFGLLRAGYDAAVAAGFATHVGQVITSDLFYPDNPLSTAAPTYAAEWGILAVEMETAALYTLCAKFGARALSVLTISDSLVTWEGTSSTARQETFGDMVQVGLRAAFA